METDGSPGKTNKLNEFRTRFPHFGCYLKFFLLFFSFIRGNLTPNRVEMKQEKQKHLINFSKVRVRADEM